MERVLEKLIDSGKQLVAESGPPHVIIFGLAGVGKTTVGTVFKELGYTVLEADDLLTPDMQWALANDKPFTLEMLGVYFHVVADAFRSAIQEQQTIQGVGNERVALTQAFYRREWRNHFRAQFPGVIFVRVHAEDELIETNLKGRLEDTSYFGPKVTIERFRSDRPYFEYLDEEDPHCVVNDGVRGDRIYLTETIVQFLSKLSAKTRAD